MQKRAPLRALVSENGAVPAPRKKRSSYSRFFGLFVCRMGKAGVKINLDSRAVRGPYLTSKSGVFWQTEPLKGVFSTRTEKNVLQAFLK
jgi:hypothetical protein